MLSSTWHQSCSVNQEKLNAASDEFLARQTYDRKVDAAEDAREFASNAAALVDFAEADRKRIAEETGVTDMLAYLKRKYPMPAAQMERLRELHDRAERRHRAPALPPRFVQVAPVRFGRTRLFLSKFIGDLAWRGVSL